MAENEEKGITTKKKATDVILDPTQYTENRKKFV